MNRSASYADRGGKLNLCMSFAIADTAGGERRICASSL